MRRNILENEGMTTLRKTYNIWEERPRIIASKVTSEPDFTHMVHRLEHQSQILHVTMGLSKDSDGKPVKR